MAFCWRIVWTVFKTDFLSGDFICTFFEFLSLSNHYRTILKMKEYINEVWFSPLHPGLNLRKSTGERFLVLIRLYSPMWNSESKERDDRWWRVMKITWSDHGHHLGTIIAISTCNSHLGDGIHHQENQLLTLYNDSTNLIFLSGSFSNILLVTEIICIV